MCTHVDATQARPPHSIHINIRSSHNNLRLNAVDHMDAVVEVENDNIRIVPRIFQQLVMK